VNQPSAADREYTAHTLDETVWVRVAGSGQVLGVQLEPAVMAYFEGQAALRTELEQRGTPQYALTWMATAEDLAKAQARLRNL
jgi:hypothetical protein